MRWSQSSNSPNGQRPLSSTCRSHEMAGTRIQGLLLALLIPHRGEGTSLYGYYFSRSISSSVSVGSSFVSSPTMTLLYTVFSSVVALGEVGRKMPGSGNYWVCAGSISALALPEDTTFLSATALKNGCPETFQMLFHFSPTFVSTPSRSLLGVALDLPKGLEVISFGVD